MKTESITCYGKRDFMNVTKLRILTWGYYPCGSQMLSQVSLQEEAEEDKSIGRRKEGDEARWSVDGFENGGRDQEPIQEMQL